MSDATIDANVIGGGQVTSTVTSQAVATGNVTSGGQGPPGQDLRIDGVAATYGALPGSAPDGAVWLVQADGKLYVRMGGAWPSNGSGIPLRGPPGAPGADGQPRGMYAATIGDGVRPRSSSRTPRHRRI
jgi:hypothetical protein